jgi:hypothetical protein
MPGAEAHIGAERVLTPAADEVACRASAVNRFVMTTAAAKVARPTAAARLLRFDPPFREPSAPAFEVDAGVDIAQRSRLIIDEPVAGGELALRRDTEIARPRATRVRTMRPAMDLPKRGLEIGEAVALTRRDATLVFLATRDHLPHQPVKIHFLHLEASARSIQHRRSHQYRRMYRGENYARLVAIKRKYDPRSLFSFGQTVLPPPGSKHDPIVAANARADIDRPIQA